MNRDSWLPLLALLSSLGTGLFIFPLPDKAVRLRSGFFGYFSVRIAGLMQVSALLHAVAVGKADIALTRRVVFDVYGIALSAAWSLSDTLLLGLLAATPYSPLRLTQGIAAGISP